MNSVFEAFADIKEQMTLLMVSGSAGAFTTAILAPSDHWKQRVAQAIGGFLGAVCVGGVGAKITEVAFDAGPWAWLAWGYLMGLGGQEAVRSIQRRLLGKDES